MERDPYEELGTVHFRRTELAIIEALSDAYPRRMHMRDLVDNVYAFDPNGGPENAVGVIRTTMVGLRKMLPPHGWTIPKQSCGRGNQGFYYLEPVANDNVPAAERAAKDRRAAA